MNRRTKLVTMAIAAAALAAGMGYSGVHPAERGKPSPSKSNAIVSVAFSPDGRTLAAIASDQSYCVWDSTTGKKLKQVSLLLGTSERAKSVHHTAEGPVMLVYKREEEAISSCLWNMATDKRSPFVEVSRGALIPRLAICPNGKFLAYENKLCEIATGRIIRQFKAVE